VATEKRHERVIRIRFVLRSSWHVDLFSVNQNRSSG